MLAGAPYVSLLEAPGVDRVAAAYQFNAIARRMRPEVATNLFDCLPKLGIGTHPGLRGRRDPGGRRGGDAGGTARLARTANVTGANYVIDGGLVKTL